MREVRHPADKLIRNVHGHTHQPDADLMKKMDRAGIPTMNLFSWSGCVFGMLVYFLDELTDEIVFRWYEPGERVPPIQLPSAAEVQPYVEQFKSKPLPIVGTTGKRVILDDEDDQL